MTAKEYLQQAHFMDLRIKDKLKEISAMNDLAVSCTATLSDMPRNTSSGSSRMEEAICNIVDMQNEIADEMDSLVKMKSDIMGTIAQIEDIELRIILEKRYLHKESWEEITSQLNHGRRWVFRLHERALHAVQKILDKK